MKKIIALTIVAIFCVQGMRAQEETEIGLFNHLSAGISLGTTGVGIEVAAPLNNMFHLRAGYSFMPKFKVKVNKTFDNPSEDFLRKEDGSGYYDNVDIEAKPNIGDLKLLLDYYPQKNRAFHFTVGAYIGSSKVASAVTTNHFINQKYWGNSGPELGNSSNTYTVVSEPDGSVKADVKVNSFKPYVGLGFGRAVPNKNLSVCVDLGVQFWGKPSLWTKIDDNIGTEYRKVEKSKILSKQSYCEDIVDALDKAEKFIVYPVLTVRLNGRIF